MKAFARLSRVVFALRILSGCSVEPPPMTVPADESSMQSTRLEFSDFEQSNIALEPRSQTPGCGIDGGERGVTSQRIQVRGLERSYLLFVPPGYDPKKPHRLVFGWHGLGLSGTQMRSFVSPIESLAGDEAIFVYPDTAIYGRVRNLDRSPNGVDVAMFDAVVQTLSQTYCIDTQRVFAIGFSDGGFFVNALAQARPQAVRGLVSIAGGGGGGPNVAAMIIHSRDDSNVGFGYGLSSVQQWATANSCRFEDYTRLPLHQCRLLPDCKSEYPVHFCPWGRTMPNQGTHDWPRFASANQDIWGFIQRL